MSEIEKLYKNAGVEKDCRTYKNYFECPFKSSQCEECEHFDYPLFTAEKQLEIIKFLIGKYAIFKKFRSYEQKDLYVVYYECRYFPKQYLPFKEALAESINHLWQDLTEEEQEQIRSILNGN